MRNAPAKLFVAGLIAMIPGIGQCADRIQVCVQPAGYVPTIVLLKAKVLTSQMLATAGVTVEWHSAGRSGCAGMQETQRVNVGFTGMTPLAQHPGALAYAEANHGSEIVVMFDRVEHATKRSSQAPNVLAHVMTHEITHILQGVPRHSESGVMKARWSPNDFDLMEYHPLTFAAEDIELIQRGLALRAEKRAIETEAAAILPIMR